MIRAMPLKRKPAWTLSVASLILALMLAAGCAPVSSPALERARVAYERVRRDPEIAGRAAVALDRTRLALEQAERSWERKRDPEEVEHYAYLTEKRAEIARAVAKRRIAADEIQQLKAQPKLD
jgi:hypothetical protein